MDNKLLFKISSIVSGISGVIILLGVLYPILSYQDSEGPDGLISPVVREESKVSVEEYDFTKASNWFPDAANEVDFGSSGITYFNLSIDKLNIVDATVAIGGEDLSDHLIQYPGTALPGRPGNSVIFGHSILPIFYNPKDYISIFSTLPTLKKGDEISVKYDGIAFKYRVEEMFEVYPTDIEVLEQNYSDSFLTLVTCVPPGDPRKPKRLIVRARVVPPETAYLNTNEKI